MHDSRILKLIKKRLTIMLLFTIAAFAFIGCGERVDSEPSLPDSGIGPADPVTNAAADTAVNTTADMATDTPADIRQPAYTMVTEKDTYPLNTSAIDLIITNTSNVEGGFDFYYGIERYTDGAWEILPLEFAVIDLYAILPPGESGKLTVNLYPDQYNYTSGLYRVTKTDSSIDMAAEFTLE